ncbi:MFS transporter [Altericroceibacterium endophyticum]|uniref:MFS transporter n=1 Tax=Altericroceibacterium endophyticum TaxID=1808508 RepID=A0A6I4T0F5_9SPHN|nr:MFS transporter [Altericroceibacterium endophyticum]MXO64584.1 MFS transporter [Altericroceibacterium endophyticum]
MFTSLVSVRTLLVAIFVIMAGGGFLSTLISVRLEAQGANAFTIGLVAAAYFAGITIGSVRVPQLIARVGHIRSFAAFVSLFSASSLAYSITMSAPVWGMLRLVDGFMMAGVFVCLESWLNRQASATTRSSILAAYMIALYGGQALGQFLLNLGTQQPSLPFVIAAILLSLSVVPVALTKIDQPQMEHIAPFSLRRLYDASPLGVIGVLTTGAILGAFYAMGAVFIQRLGMGLAEVAFFTSCVIGGGVALQWPLGLLSDRFDRRTVIIGCMGIVLAISIVLSFFSQPSALLFVLGTLFGGFAFALYPLCVAHSNDHLTEEQRVGASSGLVLTYSAGAVVGPMIASAGMQVLGVRGLFATMSAFALVGTLFALWRAIVGKPVSAEDQGAFQSLPRTTPMVAVLEVEEE